MTMDPRLGVVDPALRVVAESGIVLRERSTLSPLIRAILLGIPALDLKKYKEHVESVDEKGRTPLRYAVELGVLETVKELVENLNANVDTADADGITPLHIACARGDGEILDVLLIVTKNISPVDRLRGETPLITACRNMHWHLVERLVKIDPNLSDNLGRTALHWVFLRAASTTDCIEAIELLFLNQANVNAQDKHGKAPLHFAAERGMSDACALLYKKGAKLNVTDEKGETPLHRSCSCPTILQGKTAVLQTLLDLKSDATIRRADGKTIEDIIVQALKDYTWNDSQRIAIEVALRRIRKALEVKPQ